MVENTDEQELVSKLSRFILQNEQGMIKEQDLRNFCSDDEEFKQIVLNLVKNFKLLGLSLVRTKFEGHRYFVLTIPGKAKNISPSMYGTLGLIFATYNELGNALTYLEMKKIFKDIWDDVELLLQADYLKIIEEKGEKMLYLTPIAKAALKNIGKDLTLKSLIDSL